MDSEDDICILPSSPEEDVDIDAGPHHILPFHGLLPTSPTSVDRGSHHALQKAYAELKRRLNETTQQNQKLSKRVLELESSPQRSDSFITIGDSFDMVDDARLSHQMMAGVQHVPESQAGGEESYVGSLQRQLGRSKSQLTAMETMYQDKLQKSDVTITTLTHQLHEAQAQVAVLSKEKATLKQTCEVALREKQMALQSLHNMQEKCESLQVERDRAREEGTSLQLSLQKASQEVASLKERRDDSLTLDPPPELVGELARMRRVIDSLKKTVLAQREHLAIQSQSLSMRGSMSRSQREVSSTETESSPLSSARSGGSPSVQSWEMVNGAAAPSSSELQQRSGQSSPRPDPTKSIPARPAVNGQGGEGAGGQVPVFPGQKAKTDIVRRRSEDDASKLKSKTEVIRSNTLPQTPRLGEWMGAHYQHNAAPLPPDQAGLNQFLQTPAAVTQGVTAQPRQAAGMQCPPPAYSPHQGPPGREPVSTYDNFAFSSGANATSTATTTITSNHHNNNNSNPAMHILNQSSMTGACVLQNNSGSFTGVGGRGRSMTPTNRTPTATGRDGDLTQEHAELTRPLNLTEHEPIRFANEMPPAVSSSASGSHPARSMLDRKCPVCYQDFPHITMDEFQTHVFECFDDADESGNTPETLQPQRETSPPNIASSSERACPMCQQVFNHEVSQSYFEAHVQSHFEEVVNHFEVLELQRV